MKNNYKLDIWLNYISQDKLIFIYITDRFNWNNWNKYISFKLNKAWISKMYTKIKIKDFIEVLDHYKMSLLIEEVKKDNNIIKKKIRV